MSTHGSPFGDVDRSENPQRFVHYMDCSHRSESDEERSLMRSPLRTSEGQRILDVGCGPGNELVALTEIVGPTGAALGVDNSFHMIREANSRLAPAGQVAVADAHALPFRSRAFHACRTERVLQHVEHPQVVVNEMTRVVASGGRVLAIEPDWGTFAVDSPYRDVTRKIIIHKCDHSVRHGWIGRHLPRLFATAGLQDIEVQFIVGRHVGFEFADKLTHLSLAADRSVQDGLISPEERDVWVQDLRSASKEGIFFASLTRILVAASKAG